MRRRKAIRNIGLLVGGALAGGAGWRWWRMRRQPPMEVLQGNLALLDDLAETIIPATDTPGAKAAGVGPVIFTLVRDCADRMTQNNFIEGVQDVIGKSRELYGKPFGECSQAQREELLASFEDTGDSGGLVSKVRKRLTGASFYTTLKKYAVLGYCTSKAGATEAMRYDYIPGKYVGSLPLQPGQRSWATR
ncbi:MAG: gluconate 2-dehydrogenase subunit 3 family protein [Bacteroidetes bacterium]|nr:gluconate 2-dehydrogenase subunit 3 family protein [Bacteroidota bacterium]